MAYDIGDQVRCSVTFVNTAGTDTDPTAVTCLVRTPAAAETAFVYGVAGVTKEATGRYYHDHTVTTAGTYYVRWNGTGAVIAAVEMPFRVDPSNFDSP